MERMNKAYIKDDRISQSYTDYTLESKVSPNTLPDLITIPQAATDYTDRTKTERDLDNQTMPQIKQYKVNEYTNKVYEMPAIPDMIAPPQDYDMNDQDYGYLIGDYDDDETIETTKNK